MTFPDVFSGKQNKNRDFYHVIKVFDGSNGLAVQVFLSLIEVMNSSPLFPCMTPAVVCFVHEAGP